MMPVLLNAHLNAKYSCWFRPRAPAMCAAPKRAHHLSITLFGACPISASLEQLEKCSNIGVTAAIVQEMDAYVFPLASIPDTWELGCSLQAAPIPRQQLIEPAHRMAAGHPLQRVLEVGERLDVIEFRGGD
jgi:hypothetical protein